MKIKMKFRDLLAVPFWIIGMICDFLAIAMGGEWTSKMFLDEIDLKYKAKIK